VACTAPAPGAASLRRDSPPARTEDLDCGCRSGVLYGLSQGLLTGQPLLVAPRFRTVCARSGSIPWPERRISDAGALHGPERAATGDFPQRLANPCPAWPAYLSQAGTPSMLTAVPARASPTCVGLYPTRSATSDWLHGCMARPRSSQRQLVEARAPHVTSVCPSSAESGGTSWDDAGRAGERTDVKSGR
jgi:hypothetical protein